MNDTTLKPRIDTLYNGALFNNKAIDIPYRMHKFSYPMFTFLPKINEIEVNYKINDKKYNVSVVKNNNNHLEYINNDHNKTISYIDAASKGLFMASVIAFRSIYFERNN